MEEKSFKKIRCVHAVKNRLWNKESRNKKMEIQRKYRKAFPEKQRELTKRKVDNLTPLYICEQIEKRIGIERLELRKYPYIIENEIELLKLRREIKNGKQQH